MRKKPQGAVLLLHKSGETFDPVPGITILQGAYLAEGGSVNVSADNSLNVLFQRYQPAYGILESSDVVDSTFNRPFGCCAQRPVVEAQHFPDPVYRSVQPKQNGVPQIPEVRQPADVLNNDI